MVGDIPEKAEHLKLASEIRLARNETNRLKAQVFMEERKLWLLERKCYFLTNRQRELQELNSHSSPEGLVERIEQDSEILKFIVRHKIPKDMEESSRKIQAMQSALGSSVEYASDLEPIRTRIVNIQKEIQSLESELKAKDNDASLGFARQKAGQNTKKKLELLEELEELRRDMLENQSTLRERREERKKLFPEGIPCLSNRDYKEYVKTMRVKAARYKSMRAEIQRVQAEIDILSSTKFLVEQEFQDSVEKLKALEAEWGLVGFSCVYERIEQQSSQLQNDEAKIRYIYEMSEKARALQERVKAKKSDIEPLSREVIEAKQEIKALELHGKRLSNAYEAEMGPIQESIRRFETRIDKINDEIIRSQEDICRLSCEISVKQTNLERAVAEAELLEANPTSSRSYKNKFLTRIIDQERLQKSLNLEMSELEQTQAKCAQQCEMWLHLKRILELKKSLIDNE